MIHKRLLFFLVCPLIYSLAIADDPNDYEVKISNDHIVARYNSKLIWQYNFVKAEGKPYFHPLASTSGHVFSDLRPDDHPWHRGLWFSWKYIDGVNYWEENRDTGQSDGKTRITKVEKRELDDSSIQVKLKLSYTPGDSQETILNESRTVTIHRPSEDGIYPIIWESTFYAVKDSVLLDRTPLLGEQNGKRWGGYAGWSLRMNKASLDGVFTNSQGQMGLDAKSKSASWISYDTTHGDAVLFMDHPTNLNYPNTWYISAEMPYFSPAVLFNKRYILRKEAPLHLRYQIFISPRKFDSSRIEKTWRNWSSLTE